MSFIANSNNLLSANGPEKLPLVIVTMFTGFFGGQMFYIGKPRLGIFCIVFCWTGIPAVLACLDLVRYVFMSDEAISYQYEKSNSALLMASGAFALLAVFALLVFNNSTKPVAPIGKVSPSEWMPTSKFITEYKSLEKIRIDLSGAPVSIAELELVIPELPTGFAVAEIAPAHIEWSVTSDVGSFTAGSRFGIKADPTGVFSSYALNIEHSVIDSCLPGFLP